MGHFIVMRSKGDWLRDRQSGVDAVLSNNWWSSDSQMERENLSWLAKIKQDISEIHSYLWEYLGVVTPESQGTQIP